ncbi:MAG: hypothetical protein AAF798_00850 [Bacteroidota bacterium]
MSEDGGFNAQIKLFFKDFQNVLTFGYISLVAIGMIFEGCYYYHFGINIFEYADILDFLLGPFRRPISIFVLLVNIVIFLFVFRIDNFYYKNYPKMHRMMNLYMYDIPFFKRNRVNIFVLVALSLLLFYAYDIGKEAAEEMPKLDPNYQVIFADDPKSSAEYFKIGQNRQYLFMLDSTKKVNIIPINSQIQVIKPY